MRVNPRSIDFVNRAVKLHDKDMEIVPADTWEAHIAMDAGSIDPNTYYNRLTDKHLLMVRANRG